MAKMLARRWSRPFTCGCCDHSRAKGAARRLERRGWQRDWDGWR